MDRPIAILDSDVGGLRVMTALALRAPAEDFVYLADTGRGPYGARPVAEVRRWTEECAYYLLRFDPKVLVVTCHTMGVVAGEDLRKRLRVPVFVTPGLLCQQAAAESTDRPLALLATETALAMGFYQDSLGGAAPSGSPPRRRLVCCPVTSLLEALEAQASEEEVRALLDEVLAPARQAGASTLLLGDGLLSGLAGLVGEVLGVGARVVDVGDDLVDEVERMLTMTVLARPPGPDGERTIFVSGDRERFRARGVRVCGEPLGRVDAASPERFFRQLATLGQG